MKPAVPTATYRVQLTSEFGFQHCALVLPYLAALGISTLYCSPVLQAASGSAHGYDTVDPTRLSANLGGEEGWSILLDTARKYSMTLLLDIVPNHMAATPANPWWRDVLEYGRLSPYAGFFDIDWEPKEPWLRNRVLLPLLPTPLEDMMAGGRLSVHLTTTGLVLRYEGTELPLDLRSYRHLLTPLVEHPSEVLTDEFVRIVRLIAVLHSVRELPASRSDLLYELRTSTKKKLLHLLCPSQDASSAAREGVAAAVRSAAERLSADTLFRILREQHYVLDFWKSGRNHVNYRRFFEISDLVGIRMEDSRVFDATHDLLHKLSGTETVVGFRVDHIDGLRLPRRYLEQLRSLEAAEMSGSSTRTPYIVVEKILGGDETLPEHWPVEGTTGYDFLTEVAGLFIEPSGLSALRRYHTRTTRSRTTRRQLTYDNKRLVLTEDFRPDLSRLARLLLPVAKWRYPAVNISTRVLTSALADVSAALPVYRTYYAGRGQLSDTDRGYVEAALLSLRPGRPVRDDSPARDVVRLALTLDLPENAPGHVRQATREHLLRWQQLTGAAMAKGFEDTTLYQDSTLLALNTVGGRECLVTTSLENFHTWNQQRLKNWPHTLNCTATHDTKRGEDARARLAVLSEMSEIWMAAADRWFSSLKALDAADPFLMQVDSATHLFFLQTMAGAWPEDDDSGAFGDRLIDYMVKVAREAKTRSSWLEPDHDYERALTDLIRFSCDGEGAALFQKCFSTIIAALRFHGLVNSLEQLLLKVTCPGVPDFYQGTELFDLSLVDPDNRRPVDYALRQALLGELERKGADRLQVAAELASAWPDARAKMYVTSRALSLRRTHTELFRKGDYEPLYADGAHRNQVCAFARRHRSTWVVVVVPLRSLTLTGINRLPLGTAAWGAESLTLPSRHPASFENVLTGERVGLDGGHLPLSEVFRTFPVALLLGRVPRRT